MATDDIVSQAKKLKSRARGDSVKVKHLTNGEGAIMGMEAFNQPLISYLLKDEQPHHMYPIGGIKISGADSAESGCAVHRGKVVVTNMRVLVVTYQELSDDVVSIPLSLIENIGFDKNYLRTSWLNIYTDDYEYSISTTGKPKKILKNIESMEAVNQAQVEEVYQIGTSETNFVCSKCRENVPPDAEKCPHCGYYPGKGGKGGLWNATAVATSWHPIGMGMLAKSAADSHRARKGIAEEVAASNEAENADEDEDDFDKLERLSELNDKGVLSDEEFEEKKEEILDQL
jgi:hypothetical protein